MRESVAGAARAVTGTIQRPRSGGGPIGLPMGEPPGLVPGGAGGYDYMKALQGFPRREYIGHEEALQYGTLLWV